MVPRRALALVLILTIAIPATLAESPSDADADAEAALCPQGMQTMEGVGRVCPLPNGLYETYSPTLQPLGTIHGTDPLSLASDATPLGDGLEAQGGTSVACVAGAAGTYFIQVIYARAFDDADQYASLVPSIRTLTGNANKLVDDAAIATGGTASLRVKCVGGLVEVINAVLPTAKASANFNTIIADLQAMGYNDGKVKHWVYYDDTGACSCAGIGHIYYDDSPGVTNLNNGNGVPFFAINFGYPSSTRTWLHELGHNLGAVQKTSPNTSGAGHCRDGLDTMCYQDGGPTQCTTGFSCPGTCAVEVFDCGKNDYFHRNPAPGSYLATKWNIANSVNRYIEFGVPTLTSLSCAPSNYEIGAATTCSFLATDDGTVRYTVNWGDSTTTNVPAPPAFTAPGVTQTASKTYSTTGTKTISVTVVDNAGNAGNTLTTNVVVNPPAAPVMASLDCTPPSPLETGMTMPCTFRATDGSSGLYYTVNWGDSTSENVPTSGFVAPGVTQGASHVYTTAGSKTVSVTATDNGGLTSSALTRNVNVIQAVPPTITTFSCNPTLVQVGATSTCSFRATDTSSGVKYTLDWGDSSSTTVPASGFTAPGVTLTSGHSWGSPGPRTITLTVTDNTGLTATTTTSITVTDDATPPTLTVSDPNGATLYRGCGTKVPTLTGGPVWVQTACVKATASDDRSGVARVEVYVNGFLRATKTTAPYDFEFPVPDTFVDATVRVLAWDGAGNAREVIRIVDMVET